MVDTWSTVIQPKDTHHIPLGDYIDHTTDGHCICGPTHRSDMTSGALRWNVWHHSLDGREAHERR